MTFPVLPVLGSLTALAGLMGCATSPATTALADWQGTELKATRLVSNGTEVPLLADRPITLQLEPEGRVAGRASVNRYFGGFTPGTDGTIVWQGGLGSTRMAGPPEAMGLEAVFFQVLPQTTQVKAGRDTLTFQSADGKNRVRFVKP